MKRLLILTPIKAELKFLRKGFEELGFQSTRKDHFIESWEIPNFTNEWGLTLAHGGHGKVQFAVQTMELLKEKYDGVICAGASGSLVPEVKACEIVIAEKTIEHDYKERFSPNDPLPEFEGSRELEALFNLNDLDFKVHRGIVASGDEDVISPERAAEIHQQTRALCVAWEGAGGARACRFSRIPYLEVRAMSDQACSNAPSDFKENLPMAMANIAKLLKSISSNPL